MARKIKEIEQLTDTSIKITLNNKETATLYKWGKKDVYTTVSDSLHKSTLSELKKDCLFYSFCAEKIKKKWKITN